MYYAQIPYVFKNKQNEKNITLLWDESRSQQLQNSIIFNENICSKLQTIEFPLKCVSEKTQVPGNLEKTKTDKMRDKI